MRRRGRFLRLAMFWTVIAATVAAGVGVAAQGSSSTLPTLSSLGPGNSGATKPGKGCGDKNHYHERYAACKKQECEATLASDDAAFAQQQADDLAAFQAQLASARQAFLNKQAAALAAVKPGKARNALAAQQKSDLGAFDAQQATSLSAFTASQTSAHDQHAVSHQQQKAACDAIS